MKLLLIIIGLIIVIILYSIIYYTKHRKKYCGHYDIKFITVIDRVYDKMTDNDDLEDKDTYVQIMYCADCGSIIAAEKVTSEKNKVESHPFDIQEFRRVTGFDLRGNSILMYMRDGY